MTKEEFKALRLKLGMTQEKIAPLLGIETSAVCKMEKGINPVNRSVELLALSLLNPKR